MPIIPWEKTTQLGIPAIDDQHAKLILLYNDLVTQVDAYHEDMALMQALENLCTYAVTHFEFEEQLMERANYPELAAHRREHNDLIRAAETILERGKQDIRATLTPTTVAFLGRWITSHIDNADIKYVSCLQERKSA